MTCTELSSGKNILVSVPKKNWKRKIGGQNITRASQVAGTGDPAPGDQGLPEEVAIEEPLDSRDIAKGEAAGPVTD